MSVNSVLDNGEQTAPQANSAFHRDQLGQQAPRLLSKHILPSQVNEQINLRAPRAVAGPGWGLGTREYAYQCH